MLQTLGEFDPNVEGIVSYLERVQLYFESNAVEGDWKVGVLLIVVGSQDERNPKESAGTDPSTGKMVAHAHYTHCYLDRCQSTPALPCSVYKLRMHNQNLALSLAQVLL